MVLHANVTLKVLMETQVLLLFWCDHRRFLLL